MPVIAPVNVLPIDIAKLDATSLLGFVGLIIKKVKETQVFRSECTKLANTCIILSLAFLENEAALKRVRSGKEFINCLQQIFLLVSQCTAHWSILHIGWEVVICHRVEELTKQLEQCQKIFDTEVLVCRSILACGYTLILLDAC